MFKDKVADAVDDDDTKRERKRDEDDPNKAV